MSTRNLVAAALLSVAGLTAFTTDADAGIFRKKNRGNNCNTCSTPCNTCGGYAAAPAPCNTCGGVAAAPCSSCGGGVTYGSVPSGGVPTAMPSADGSTVVPASGTTTTDGSTVIPSGGTVLSNGTVMPAGGYWNGNSYVMPASGSYYPNGGYYGNGFNQFGNGYNQTFQQGVIQGALGMPSNSYYGSPYYGGTIQNTAGRRLGGLFRR